MLLREKKISRELVGKLLSWTSETIYFFITGFSYCKT